jgi:hypothetical protein
MPRHNWVWSEKIFENVSESSVKTAHSRGAWKVTISEKNLAWGYCIRLSDEACSHIMWHARVDVRKVKGGAWPGLALHDSQRGMLFMVNGDERFAELRLLEVGREAIRTDIFDIGEINPPFAIALGYNAITSKCIGKIAGKQLFDFKLPHGDIPSLVEVTSIEIVTITPPDDSGGSVEYGRLFLDCE